MLPRQDIQFYTPNSKSEEVGGGLFLPGLFLGSYHQTLLHVVGEKCSSCVLQGSEPSPNRRPHEQVKRLCVKMVFNPTTLLHPNTSLLSCLWALTEFCCSFLPFMLQTPEWLDSDSCQKCDQPFFWNFKQMWDSKKIGLRQVRMGPLVR